jgi:predicted lipoprotein
MNRRSPLTVVLFVITLAVAFARLVPSGSIDAAERVTKQAAVASIAQNVMLPGYADLTARCAELTTAADGLALVPSAASLKRTQQAWVSALLAWRRTQAFVRGPVTDLNALGRLQFWPLRPQSIDKVLRDSRPIDAAYVDALGATAIGLFPIEKLLFDPGKDAVVLAAFTGPQGERRRMYVRAAVRDLEARVRAVEKAWSGPNGYAASFAAGGQASINLLVNDILEAVEVGAQGRLFLIKEWNTARVLRPEFVEAGLSAASQQGVLSLLAGAEERFNGGDKAGLDDYLRTLNPSAAERVRTQFRKTIAAVAAIGMPLDQVTPASHYLIAKAHEEARALEIILKVEVASALGVTLTFRSIDGD